MNSTFRFVLEPRDRIDLLTDHAILADFLVLERRVQGQLALDQGQLGILISLVIFVRSVRSRRSGTGASAFGRPLATGPGP